MGLTEWAAAWGIPQAALADLAARLTRGVEHSGAHSERGVQDRIRLEAARRGTHLFRNNVGAAKTDTGSWVRFGLANDSHNLNARLKSSDLIGFERLDCGPFGYVARFLSVECKLPGWKYNPNDEHEQAQLAWLMLVNNAGGRGMFATGPDAL